MEIQKLFTSVLLPAATIFTLFTPVSMQAQSLVPDPVPEHIVPGDLILELENWIRMPQTFGPGSGGRARLSILRSLPDGRIFVNDNRGQLYVIENDVIQNDEQPYMNIGTEILSFKMNPGLGTGFQSFAFHPEFHNNGKFYTVHSEEWNAVPASQIDFRGPTVPVTGSNGALQTVVTEWTAADPAENTFIGTHRELFRVYFPTQLHAIQEVAFNPTVQAGDPDYGMLYVCIGEGGSYLEGRADNQHRLDSPMGTIFRIDPQGNNSANGQYGIPADNPWADTQDSSVIREIYAYGFRNPHRINWDPEGENRMYLGDIGETQVEELNLIVPGGDYGFPSREGTFLLRPNEPQNNTRVYSLPENDDTFGYVYPVAQYDHDEGIAIVLGPVYRGPLEPLYGKVLFGDIAYGRIFAVDEASLELGHQADIEELRLELDGVEGSLTSFVGSGRADLRWGIDHNDQVYIMTKTDGWIRKVTGVRTAASCIDSNWDNWDEEEDFSAGDLSGLNVVRTGSGGEVRIADDPYGDTDNEVLSVSGSNSLVRKALTQNLSGLSETVYFRFALENTGVKARFALSPQTAPFIPELSSVLLSASGDGTLSVFDGSEETVLTDDLRTGIWYELWIVFPCLQSNFEVYIRGGNRTAPALLASGIAPKISMSGGLKSVIWATATGSAEGAEVFFDDLYVDSSANNLSSPLGDIWALVSNFEHEDFLDYWTFTDVDNGAQSEPPLESIEWAEEITGNRVLRVQATPVGATRTIGHVSLPSTIEVSRNATLYGRMLVEQFPTNQIWGLVNVAASEIPDMIFDSVESISRITGSTGEEAVLVRDGGNYETANGDVLDNFAVGKWYEYWMVIRNGGRASGGQTFDLYWRDDDSEAEPELIYEDADFRVGRESPFERFAIIADNVTGGPMQAVWYDDIFIIPGEVLESPNGTGSGILPGPSGVRRISWFGQISDVHAPWIYHEKHGWLYVAEDKRSGSWFYDVSIGWVWLRPEYYPHVYHLTTDGGEWINYRE